MKTVITELMKRAEGDKSQLGVGAKRRWRKDEGHRKGTGIVGG